MASKRARIATTTIQRVVLSRASLSLFPATSHANTNKIHQQQQEQWIRRCHLLDASRGFQYSDDNDDDDEIESALTMGMQLLPSSTSNKKKRPLPAFPLEARHFGGYHGQLYQHSISSRSDSKRVINNKNKNNTPT